jgi:hypothetical protein
MALGLNYDTPTGGGGDFLAVVKYNAKAGRWARVDREDNSNVETDITRTFKAVADLENVETGWISFVAGQAPDFDVVVYPNTHPARTAPTPNHKSGARLIVKLHSSCGGDVREIASVSKAFIRGLDDLHDQYLEGVKKNPGKLPVIVMADTIPIVSEGKGQKSTNYCPQFEIVNWVGRPDDLVHQPRVSTASSTNSRVPPSTGSTKVSAPVNTDDDDFG